MSFTSQPGRVNGESGVDGVGGVGLSSGGAGLLVARSVSDKLLAVVLSSEGPEVSLISLLS